MSSLLDSVQQQLGQNEISQISEHLGVDPTTARSAIDAALPMIVGGLAQNASQPAGASAIHSSLDAHSGVLGSLAGLLGAGAPADSGGLLGRILGQHQAPVQQGVQQASGLDADKTRRLLMMLAPIVMGVLARRHASAQSSPGQLGTVLQQEGQEAQQRAQTQAPQLGGILGQIFKGF